MDPVGEPNKRNKLRENDGEPRRSIGRQQVGDGAAGKEKFPISGENRGENCIFSKKNNAWETGKLVFRVLKRVGGEV